MPPARGRFAEEMRAKTAFSAKAPCVPAKNVILTVIITISALFMIFTVLMQSSNVKGLGAIAGTFDSYFDKHKAKSAEAKLALGTKIAAAIFVACSLLMLLVK